MPTCLTKSNDQGSTLIWSEGLCLRLVTAHERDQCRLCPSLGILFTCLRSITSRVRWSTTPSANPTSLHTLDARRFEETQWMRTSWRISVFVSDCNQEAPQTCCSLWRITWSKRDMPSSDLWKITNRTRLCEKCSVRILSPSVGPNRNWRRNTRSSSQNCIGIS